MKCPYCNSVKLSVIKTENYLNSKVRRRNCKECGRSFNTVESILYEEHKLKSYLLKEKIPNIA